MIYMISIGSGGATTGMCARGVILGTVAAMILTACGDSGTGTKLDAGPDATVDAAIDGTVDGAADAAPGDGAVDAAPDAGCVIGTPADPVPASTAAMVDPTLVTEVSWNDCTDAVGYDVYFGTSCPPPSYPDAAFLHVDAAELSVTLDYGQSYCWQVVATDDGDCRTPGPVWTFETGTPCVVGPDCVGVSWPPNPPHYSDFNDDPNLPAPTTTPPPPPGLCHEPQLRLCVDWVLTREAFADSTGDQVYCVMVAETVQGAEVRVTPVTWPLDEWEKYLYQSESTMFWGQLGEPRTTGGDLAITYDCLEQADPTVRQTLVNNLTTEILAAGGSIGATDGWLVPPGAAGPIVTAALAIAASGDHHLLTGSQVIPFDRHLELTGGGWWFVRRSGTVSMSDWDWEIAIKAWGCVDNGY